MAAKHSTVAKKATRAATKAASLVKDGNELHPTSHFYRNNVHPLLMAVPGAPNWALLQARGFLRAVSREPDSIVLAGLVNNLSAQSSKRAEEFLCALQALLAAEFAQVAECYEELDVTAAALKHYADDLIQNTDCNDAQSLFPRLIANRIEQMLQQDNAYESDPVAQEDGDEE